MPAKRTMRQSTNIKIEIPNMPMWEQIGGDRDPGSYGGTLARSDGDALELLQIQPVREYVGDGEAKDVGFPFWTKTAHYDLDDLRDGMRSALKFIGMDLETLEADFTATQRALVIAEAMLDYGDRTDEGPSGWSTDILPADEKVKWATGQIETGPEFLGPEDDEFISDVLLGDLDIDYEKYGPDEDNPTSGLKVAAYGTRPVEIIEWDDVEHATGEEQPEGEKILKRSAEVDFEELFNPNAKHRRSYSGDEAAPTILDLARMDDEAREEAVIAAALAYMAYWGGEEEYVDEIGD